MDIHHLPLLIRFSFNLWVLCSVSHQIQLSLRLILLLYALQAYWDWSWDELVSYDFPATFQYVHDQTGQKLHYVGHSLVIQKIFLHYVFSIFSWFPAGLTIKIIKEVIFYLCLVILQIREPWLPLLLFSKTRCWICYVQLLCLVLLLIWVKCLHFLQEVLLIYF